MVKDLHFTVGAELQWSGFTSVAVQKPLEEPRRRCVWPSVYSQLMAVTLLKPSMRLEGLVRLGQIPQEKYW